MKRKVLTSTYGSAFPLKRDLEKQILSRYEFLSLCINEWFYGFHRISESVKELAYDDNVRW